jgi:glucokinase
MSHSQVVLGLDYGGTKIAAAVSDLAGNRLATATIASGGADGAQASFDRGIQAGRDLLARQDGSSLAAVGVSTFGIPFEDRVDLAPAISGWDRLAMGRELRAAFPGAEIRMATDAKAAAAAELRWGALRGRDPGVYLNLGTGLSAAIVAGGQVLGGGNGAAGEIGYNLRAVSDVGLALHQRVPLEWMVSARALAERAARAAGPERELSAAHVFEADARNEAFGDLIDEFVAELAFHVVNLAICIDPVRIAVGGGMVGSWERLRPGLEQALKAAVPFPPELVVADFPFDAPLIGAVALAVEAAQPRRDTAAAPVSRRSTRDPAQHPDGSPARPEPTMHIAYTKKD